MVREGVSSNRWKTLANNGKSTLDNPEAKQFLQDLVGEEGLDVILALVGREAIDEEIAEKTDLKLNTVRKILYKLYDYRLASYIRTKDKEIGWYIYTWKLDLGRIYDVIVARKRRMLEDLRERLEFESSNVFFHCKNDECKIPFDVASETEFKCPQCHSIMDFVDNQKTVMGIEKEIHRLEREIGSA
jgi:transcription initiation factor TFIIE subunit alpha